MKYPSQCQSPRKKVKNRLYDLQRGRCYICGERMKRNRSRGSLASLDQVKPRALGGGYFLGNVAMAHARCNTTKGDRKPTACEALYAASLADIYAGKFGGGNFLWIGPHIHGGGA